MPYGYQDLVTANQLIASGAMKPTFYGIAQAWYINRAPMMTWIPKLGTDNTKFKMLTYNFKPRVTQVGTGGITNVATSLPVVDASIFQNGDQLWINKAEKVEVTADPNLTANTLTIRRGIGGTTAVAAAAGLEVYNIGNSRTGSETFQKAISQLPTASEQFVQTFQSVAAVSGLAAAVGSNVALPPGIPTPMSKSKLDALQSVVDDIENTALYSSGEELGVGGVTRQKMKGLKQLIVTNQVTSPTNASAYKPVDFQRDAITSIRSAGGNPGLIMVNTRFAIGLSTWGIPLQRLQAGQTMFGTDIRGYTSPFLEEVPIVENMWLDAIPGYAAVALSTDEVRWRVLEDLKYEEYGRNGDVSEAGDWIHRCAIEVDNEAHHSWVQGITGFAAQ